MTTTYVTPWKLHLRIVEAIGFFPKVRTPEAVASYWDRRIAYCTTRLEFGVRVIESADDVGMPIQDRLADLVAEVNAYGAEYWHCMRMKDRNAA